MIKYMYSQSQSQRPGRHWLQPAVNNPKYLGLDVVLAGVWAVIRGHFTTGKASHQPMLMFVHACRYEMLLIVTMSNIFTGHTCICN